MISVIIPIYNSANYLSECVESVLSQSFDDIEVILVDDGSSDGSIEIEESFALRDNRVIIAKQHHSGPFLARKTGAMLAKGEYITFVDSDDFVEKQAYELARNDMETGIECIIFGINRYCTDGIIKQQIPGYRIGRYNRQNIETEILPTFVWDIEHNKFGVDPSLCTKLFNAELLKQTYNEMDEIRYQFGEDVAIVYPLMMKLSTLSIHDEIYYNHRQRKYGDIPSYIKDSEFLNKLHDLYRHLKNSLMCLPNITKQIDLFYSNAVALNDWNYGIRKVDGVFPFDRVDKGERIVIYGAGNLGHLYIKQLSSIDYCKVILWVDIYKCNGENISHPTKLLDVSYDKIVVSLKDCDIRQKIYKYLVDIGVPKEKIIY